MIIVNIHEAKTNLSRLLSGVQEHHQKVRICRNGQPIADLVPIVTTSNNPLLQCKALQGIKVNYDPTSQLSDDEWPEGML